jgi:hypothetical protein
LLTLLGLMKISIRLKFGPKSQLPKKKLQLWFHIIFIIENWLLELKNQRSGRYYSYGYLFCLSDTKG